jgi:acyl-CoA dehydrogenase
LERASRVATQAAGPFADDVDAEARFPSEAMEAIRSEGLLSALVPRELGGAGATITEVAEVTKTLGEHCSSTALIFAMHHMQVACIVRHGHNEVLRDFLVELAECQYLLASATTELGVGGDIRTSLCAVQRSGRRFVLEKQAPVISYGAHADAIMTTARRSPESAAGDQVLVLCRPPGLTLEQTSEWDTLGFRGTCSPGFKLFAEGPVANILPAPFSEISAVTMTPTAHVLWSAAWLGMATAAVERARHFMRAEARKKPGVTPPGATRLAELVGLHQAMVEFVSGYARKYEDAYDDYSELGRMSFAIAMNNLKVTASRMLVEIVEGALSICGIAGYRLDSPHSMGRLLRDAIGASLMVSNDRILGNTAQMLLVAKES